MEDLTFNMKCPCIMDIKIGRRLYDIDASLDKINRREIKSSQTTSGSLGFRLCGVKVERVSELVYDL